MSFIFAKYLKSKLHSPVQNNDIQTEGHCFLSDCVLEKSEVSSPAIKCPKNILTIHSLKAENSET